jgi:hypothetical protein
MEWYIKEGHKGYKVGEEREGGEGHAGIFNASSCKCMAADTWLSTPYA